MTTMKAVRVHAFGSPAALFYEHAPKPEPKSGEVLIKIAAAGINPTDWKLGAGQEENMEPHTLPLTPGRDVAGTVESTGAGVSALTEGDTVFAMTGSQLCGGYAEYVALSAAIVCLKPASVDFTTAAAIPLSATTAWEALFEQANLLRGQTVLIHGAGGAVGAFAVQFAKIKGAQVIATATGADREYVRGLGADVVVDYKTEKFEDAAKGVDAVLDTIGGDTQARSWQTLRNGGVLVTLVGITTASPEAGARGVQGKAFGVHPDAGFLAEIGRLVDAGQVTLRVASVSPLSEAEQAQEFARSSRAPGKVVLEL